MTTRPARRRRAARRDIEAGIDHYLAEAGDAVAIGFIDAVEVAIQAISAHPAAGSLKYAHRLDLPGMRMWPVRKYPYLVFYSDKDRVIDVWRVVHASRDIRAEMFDGS